MDGVTLAFVALGIFIAAGLLILGLRGRFGTAPQQGEFELSELSRSRAVPRRAVLRSVAACRGHSLDSRALYGSGVLWLTDDTLGFLLRSPRRELRLALDDVTGATASDVYRRIGVDETSDRPDLLIVEWKAKGVPSTIAFQIADPAPWIDALTK